MEIGIIMIGALMTLISIGCVIWSIIINRRTNKKLNKNLTVQVITKTENELLNDIREAHFRAYLKEKSKK